MPQAPIVPIIGGGPAGMSCALWLKNYGFQPVIVERKPLLGGMQRASPYPNIWLLGRPGATARQNAAEFARHIEMERIEVMLEAVPARVRREADGTFALDVAMSSGSVTRSIKSSALVIATGTEFRGQEWIDRLDRTHALAGSGRILLGPASAGEPGFDIGTKVLVVGGGDNAFDVVHQFARPGRLVTIALRSAQPRAQPLLVERVRTHAANGLAEIRTGVAVEALADIGNGVRVQFDDGSTLSIDRIVLCLGFVPNTNDPWIESLGLRRNGDGYLVVDGNMETSCPGVFAVGDVSNPLHPCTATALASGTMAAREILLRQTRNQA